tara:strand:- start:3 stop:182 length:180 start_codon:yes stop_codon:yes gene_type:complete
MGRKKKRCKVCGLEMSMFHSRHVGNCNSKKGGFSEAKEYWKNQLYDLYDLYSESLKNKK